MTGPELSPGLVGRNDPLDQHLDASAGRLDPGRRARMTRVVEHDEIAASKQPRQVGEAAVDQRRAGRRATARTAHRRGDLRDQVRRKCVVEVGEGVAARAIGKPWVVARTHGFLL